MRKETRKRQGGLSSPHVRVINRPKVRMAKVGPAKHNGVGFGKQSPKVMLPLR